MSTPQFDAKATLDHIRQKQAIKRHRNRQVSRLEKYRMQIVALRQVDKPASFSEIQQWLREDKNLTIDRKTIWNFVHKLPELQTKQEVDDGQLSQP